MKYLLTNILILSICFFSSAQDVHFSQFNKSYLNLNPALTGSFDGTYRFNGNFRNQWSSVSEPYSTFSAAADGKGLIAKIPELQLGLIFINDEAGLGGLTNTQVNTSFGYARKLNSDSSLVAQVGIQLGFSSRRINFDRFSFDQQYTGRQFNPDLPTGEQFDRNSYSYFNLNAGIGLEYRPEDRKKFNFGASFFNLNSPNQSFDGATVPLDVRSNFYLSADHIISEKIDLLPALLYSYQGGFNEFLIGSDLRYRFDNQNSFVTNLYGGIWYRNKDAVIVSTGIDYWVWNFGVSYDVNISDLKTATNNRGGLELSVTYIFKTLSPP